MAVVAELGWILVACWLAAALLMTALWLVQRRTGNAGIVDAGWAAGLGAAGVGFYLAGPVDPARGALVLALAGIWSLRLAYYLVVDRVLTEEEDGRYQRLKRYWGERAQPWLFVFFQAQAVFVVIFAIPFLAAMVNSAPFPRIWDLLAIAVWLVSIGGESLADRQLARFRADPANRGKTCRSGLWRYSRHPNYFFEWIHWWAYVLLAVGSWTFWVALAGPVVMLIFLFRLTGIPYTEDQALASRGEDYRRYQRETSVFFPWLPRKEVS
jgi:steroid 5-alpha reductase family enzyme